MEPESYEKILVAKYSPKNGCNARDGDVLTVAPRNAVPQRTSVPHYFVSTEDPRIKSRYGWVKETDSFSLVDFVQEHLKSSRMSESEEKHIRVMLSSISKLPCDTPVAATYRSRGVTERRMVLTVHKVIFYEER